MCEGSGSGNSTSASALSGPDSSTIWIAFIGGVSPKARPARERTGRGCELVRLLARQLQARSRPSPYGTETPEVGGAGWAVVNGVIGEPDVGSVTSGPPNSTILPFRTWPISTPP